MLKKIGLGCLGFALVLVALLAGLAQTDSGRQVVGMARVFGGAMVATATAHDTVRGKVIALTRPEPPAQYAVGSIRFAYRGDDGVLRTESRRVITSTRKFRALKVGDGVDVWVCRDDRSKVKLVGFGTYEPERCGDEPGETP